MATGDIPDRPARRDRGSRRDRVVKGEPRTAPVAYLPGAWAVGETPADAGTHEGAAAIEGSTTPPSSPTPRRSGERGAHPAGTRRAGRPIDAPFGASSVDDPSLVDRGDEARPTSGDRDRRERRAANVSMSALARRGQSRWELESTLHSRELEPEVVEAELARLEGVGLIDDAALADTIVRTQHERKGLGRSALVAELRRRRIDQEHIDAALEQIDDDDELSRARELAERRARQMTSLDRDTAVRRLTGYLMRKGYSSSVVRAAVDEAFPQRGTGGVRFR